MGSDTLFMPGLFNYINRDVIKEAVAKVKNRIGL